ncbi:MAG: hypothetical protein WAO22_02165 [bacterium]
MEVFVLRDFVRLQVSQKEQGEEAAVENIDALCEYPARQTSSNTFLVKVLYTQHTSTQGIIQWIDQEKALSFRSFMELIHLLEEALQSRGDMDQFRTWQQTNQPRTEWR